MTGFTYSAAASIDGLIADRQGGTAWIDEFAQLPVVAERRQEFISGVGAVVIGESSYANLLRSGSDGASWPFGKLPVWVFTHHEHPGGKADVTFVRGDVSLWSEDIAASAGDRDVWVFGGANLAGRLLEAGLLTEVRVLGLPVLLGSGTPLIAAQRMHKLQLIERRELERGVVETRYSVSSG